ILLRWFDRWLKDDEGAPLGPRVQVQDDTGRWRNASRWPAGDEVTFHLNPDGDLSRKPTRATATELVATDPFHTQGGYENNMPTENLACAPGTCASFQSGAFEEDFRVSGLPRVELTVVPQGPGGQLTVYLYAASEEEAQRLGWGQLDLRFRDGSVKAQPVTPGEELALSFDAQPLDAVVPEGSRLVVVVSEGSGWNRLPGAPNYPIELAEGHGRSSITVVRPKPGPGAFFDPNGD
ncbi:MAG: CocE/NonD family hydrolase C-terminal non-catalytic domain-containing protein, partial [Actinomycetota bacterium]